MGHWNAFYFRVSCEVERTRVNLNFTVTYSNGIQCHHGIAIQN